MEEGIASNVKDKALSPNLTWEYPNTCTKSSSACTENQRGNKNLENKLNPQQQTTPTKNVWKLVQIMVYSEVLPEGFRELQILQR